MTNKAGWRKVSSSRVFTRMNFFVLDKGYVLIFPMKSAIEFPKAMRMFSKEVGVPIYFIADPRPRQKYK